MDHQKLAALLKELQMPNTERIKAITAELTKNYYGCQESLLALVEIIATNEDVSIRQQAAIQAARLTPQYWSKTPATRKSAVRQHLVQATMREQDTKCRHACARVIARMASLDVEENDWPELIPALYTLASNADASQRELGTYIVYCMLEENMSCFETEIRKLLDMFSKTICDPESGLVRINTMMAIGASLILFDPDEDEEAILGLQTLVPHMVQVLKDSVTNGDDEKVQQCFEVLQQFLAYESILLGDHFKDIVRFMLCDVAVNKQVDEDVRTQAISFLAQAVRYRRMKIQGMGDMGQQLTLQAMEMLTEMDDKDEEDDLSPARMALTLLDQLANDLPPRQVVNPLLDALPGFIASRDASYRKAGALALGQVVEGAPDFINSQLRQIMPQVHLLLQDSDITVRHAALMCIARLASELAEQLAPYSEILITAVVNNLQASMASHGHKDVEIIRSVCVAIDAMAAGLEGDFMRQHAGELVQHIGALLGHDDHKIKVSACGAIGAVAESIKDAFTPYFEKTMQGLGQYLHLVGSEEDIVLRGSVCDAMGRIATAVGPEAFQPYVVELMRASEEALLLDNSRLKESSFLLWSCLSLVYKEDFAPFLDGIFKALFSSIELEEQDVSLHLTETDKALIGTDSTVIHGGKKMTVKDFGDEEHDMSEEDADDWEDFTVSADALEKEVAIEVLGDILTQSCRVPEIKKFLNTAITMIKPLADHSYEGCRRTAIGTLWRAYTKVWTLMEQETGTSWEPGLPLKQQPVGMVKELGELVANVSFKNWLEEHERRHGQADSSSSVVTDINRNIAAALKACGPAILEKAENLNSIVLTLDSMINRSHPCQVDLGDENEEDDGELNGSSEYDWAIVDTALDVVISLAFALGPSFGEIWEQFQKPILKLGTSNEAVERSTAVGVIAECTHNMGAAVTQHTPALFALLIKRLSDTDDETRSNAAYATGQVIYNSQDTNTYLPAYETILQKLEPMLQITEGRIRDNAIGCISRMIMAHPDRVPIGDILPAVVALLPLKEDFEENTPLYQCLEQLYRANEPTVQLLTPQLLDVFGQVLGGPAENVEKDVRQTLCRLITDLANVHPALFEGREAVLQLAKQA